MYWKKYFHPEDVDYYGGLNLIKEIEQPASLLGVNNHLTEGKASLTVNAQFKRASRNLKAVSKCHPLYTGNQAYSRSTKVGAEDLSLESILVMVDDLGVKIDTRFTKIDKEIANLDMQLSTIMNDNEKIKKCQNENND